MKNIFSENGRQLVGECSEHFCFCHIFRFFVVASQARSVLQNLGLSISRYRPHIRLINSKHQNAKYRSEHRYFRQVWKSEREGCGGSKHFPFVASLTANVGSAFCPSKNNGVECVKKEAFLNCRSGRWSPLICVMALCEVLGVTVKSCYPNVGNYFTEVMYNTELIP